MANCGSEQTIAYDADGGPVVVIVTSGFATLGRFRCSFEQDLTWTEFGAGDLSDAIPDVFPLPLSGVPLDGRSVLLVGNYRAANPTESKQVKVTYDFMQKQKSIGKVEIAEKSGEVVHCSHLVTFEQAA